MRPETNDVIRWRHRGDAKLGNLYCREQQVASDAYKQGWDRIWGNKKDRVRSTHNPDAS